MATSRANMAVNESGSNLFTPSFCNAGKTMTGWNRIYTARAALGPDRPGPVCRKWPLHASDRRTGQTGRPASKVCNDADQGASPFDDGPANVDAFLFRQDRSGLGGNIICESSYCCPLDTNYRQNCDHILEENWADQCNLVWRSGTSFAQRGFHSSLTYDA